MIYTTKKKIFYGIAVIFLLSVIFSMPAAFAAGGLSVRHTDDDTVIVSGNSGASLKQSTAVIYINNSVGETVFADSVITDTNGGFEFVWVPASAGNYIIYVKSGNVTFDKYELWFTSVSEYNKLMGYMIGGGISDIEAVLSSENSCKTIGVDSSVFGNLSAKAVSEALYHLREYVKAEDKVLDYVDDAIVLAAFYTNPDAESMKHFYDEYILLGGELPSYDVLTDIKNIEISEYAIKRFAGLIYEELSDADQCLRDSIIISAVYKCSLWTQLDSYLSMIGYTKYDESEYKDKAAQAVAGILYDNVKALEDALLLTINDEEEPVVSSGSGGARKSTSSGITPVVTAQMEENVNNAEEKDKKIVFSDVPETHWAFEAVNYLRWNGTVIGEDFNFFYPDENITRSQMCAMLVRAYSIKGGSCDFSDVSGDSWYYEPVAAAFSAGLVFGDGEKFYPEDKLSRQDMAVLIYRFASANGKIFDAEASISFSDKGNISDYALEAVSKMTGCGMIQGMDGNVFAPERHAARAEAAKLIYEAIK